MHGSRATGLMTAGLAYCTLVAAAHMLHAAENPMLVTSWWPITALATAVLASAQPRQVRTLLFGLAVAFVGAGLLAGRDPVFAVGFAIANTIEAAIVLWWLRGFEGGRPELRSWRAYFRWLTGIGLGAAVAGVITAGTIGLNGEQDLWRPMLWVAVTHAGAQLVLLPLFLRQPRHRTRVQILEVLAHLTLLALAAVACTLADPSQPVAFLLLPMLMWAAARFPPLWASVELVVVVLGLATLTASGHGPFTTITAQSSVIDIVASAQTFVAISAITSAAFSVAMIHLRDSQLRIRDNEVRLGQLLDSASGTAFIATDLEGVITWFSPGAEQLLGYSADDVVGHTTPMPFHEDREIRLRSQKLRVGPGYDVVTHPVAQGADQDTRDWTYVRRDGSRLTVSISVTAVRNRDGAPVSFLSVVRDVTDRRVAEQALVFALDKERETNQRMLDLDRAKGEFVSAVSHELRTPLTSIIGYTEMLADDPDSLSVEQQQLVERIDRNGERLLQLVEDLLTLARAEDGKLALDRVETDLRDAVQAATEEVAHSAHKRRVSLEVCLPEHPVLLEGDPVHLERLVLNLASNAVKFTEPGGEVETTLDVDGDVARLTVRDTGMGIPLEEQGRLFQKFFRSSVATQNAIQGTGLGLHIARSIAEAHQGRVDFESVPGQGTTFWFTVPLVTTSGTVPSEPAGAPPMLRLVAAEAPAETVSSVAPRHGVDSAEVPG